MEDLNIVFINLKHRTDRLQHIVNEFDKLGLETPTRIEGVHYPKNGPLGCCASHIKAIEMAINNKWDKVLILEDDFTFTNDLNVTNNLLKRFLELGMKWDVFMFSSNLIDYENTDYSFVKKVIQGKTTSGYLLNSHYYETLLRNFKECFNGLKTEVYSKKLKHYCVDMGWRKLQPEGNWYITDPKLGKQMDGYSDIMQQYKSYNC